MKISNDLTRREVLVGAGLVVGGALLGVRGARADHHFELSEAARKNLAESPYVYVSPLHPDGEESSCHGEVWFFFDQGSVVLATAHDRWKTRAVEKGWDRARIWAGDYGRVKKDGERFREGPNFVAKASLEKDKATFERLMAAFAKKYPDEWGKWKPRFRKGYDDGSRVLIRYTPIES